MIKNVLFDLDQTLLQIDLDIFLKLYFQEINKKLLPLQINIKNFIPLFLEGFELLHLNDGTKTNEEVFWGFFDTKFPEITKEVFATFHENEYRNIRKYVQPNIYPRLIIDTLKEKGYNLILATNPIYPLVATKERLAWCGLNLEDFSYVTSYENSHYIKPHHAYFQEIINNTKIKEDECLYIGNDLDDDFSELPEKFQRHLITDFMINKSNKEIITPNSTLKEFYELIKKLPTVA
jgi:FMN phosphatase YigB (HAD superfamily)